MKALMPLAISLSVLAASAVVWLRVRHMYRKFCELEDQRERISALRKRVESAKTFMAENFTDTEGREIAENITLKINFISGIISKRDPDTQEREYSTLVKLLEETFGRVMRNRDDIPSVTAPLNTMRDRLVREQIDWLREMSDGLDISENMS